MGIMLSRKDWRLFTLWVTTNKNTFIDVYPLTITNNSKMIQKQGKQHEHDVLYSMIQNKEFDGWTIELEGLLEKNRKKFDDEVRFTFMEDTVDLDVDSFRRCLQNLTNLEKYFLGITVS